MGRPPDVLPSWSRRNHTGTGASCLSLPTLHTAALWWKRHTKRPRGVSSPGLHVIVRGERTTCDFAERSCALRNALADLMLRIAARQITRVRGGGLCRREFESRYSSHGVSDPTSGNRLRSWPRLAGSLTPCASASSTHGERQHARHAERARGGAHDDRVATWVSTTSGSCCAECAARRTAAM
jgi:hypothetical protein